MASLTQLKALFQKRQFEYQDYVTAAVADKSYNEADLVSALMAAGKTPEDFETAVELRRKRLAAVALLQSGDDTAARLADIQTESEAAQAEHQRKVAALDAKLQEKLDALWTEGQTIQSAKRAQRQAQQFLISTCDADLTQQENELLTLWRISSEKLQGAQRDVAAAE